MFKLIFAGILAYFTLKVVLFFGAIAWSANDSSKPLEPYVNFCVVERTLSPSEVYIPQKVGFWRYNLISKDKSTQTFTACEEFVHSDWSTIRNSKIEKDIYIILDAKNRDRVVDSYGNVISEDFNKHMNRIANKARYDNRTEIKDYYKAIAEWEK